MRENLLQVHLDADNARNTTEVSINLVLSIENLAIGRFINDTVSNTEKASISLDTSLFNRRLQTVLHMHLIYYSYLISAYVHVIMLLIYITARILLEVCGIANIFAVETTQLLVNTTKSSVDSFSANVSEFIAENNRIIKEINQIIASLQDVHARINTVKSYLEYCQYTD